MCEHCSDGSIVWAGIPRLAAYSKLSDRNVQHLLRKLTSRGVVTQLAPSNTAKRRPATYRINEAALTDDPRMERYRSRQQRLPGVKRPSIPGEPITSHGDLVKSFHQSGENCAAYLVKPFHQPGEATSPDSKAFDPERSNPKTFPFPVGPLSNEQEECVTDPWQRICERLRSEINPHSFDTWLRPTHFVCVSGDDLIVRIPTPEFRYVDKKFSRSITDAIAALSLTVRKVIFRTEEELAGEQKASEVA